MKFLSGLFSLIPLGAPALVLLASLVGSRHRWADILVQFASPALVGTIILLVTYLLLRQRLNQLIALVVAAGLAWVAWPQWAPEGGRPAPEAPVIRVYSANVWIRNSDVEAMRRSIEAADPDVVMLIEMGPGTRGQLDTLLAGYPYRSEPADEGDLINRAIIAARFPIAEFGRRPDGLHAVMVRGETPLGPMNFVITHLTRPWPFEAQEGQIHQVESLTARVAALTDPVVIAGDFNSVTTGRIGEMIRSGIAVNAAPGWPGTWPSALPGPARITIDQVYVTRDLAVRDRRLGQSTGSDHMPVVTEIGLAPVEVAPTP
ncbi:MAG: endonuclease/exonuclease/phosphatase family protein [Caulobacterales bacterium]|nr:endonuclease/exonuclease/phosphatase family protein [Caulobacterales bacterium]